MAVFVIKLAVMDKTTKKMAVLCQLQAETHPISLQDLLCKLGEGYAERSVRRWLTELSEEGLVQKLGHKKTTKYQLTPPTVSRRDTCFQKESQLIIEKVRRPVYERMPVTYNTEWFDSYHPNKTFYIPLKSRLQLYAAGKRLQKDEPAGTYAHKIFNRLLIDLSYNSSRLEGNTYSLLDTQKLLFEGSSAEGKLDEEKIMILNHKEAIRYLVETAPRLSVTAQAIYTLHYLLSDGLIESHYAGKVRDHGVRIGGSAYIPFEDPKQLEFQLNQIIKKASLIEDPYEQSLFLLVHLSYLQAFTDVNKRTARLATNIPLIKHNLVPLSFNDVEREDYTSAIIAIYELQNTKPILDLYLFSYMRTCQMYDATLKAVGFDEIRVRYREQRRALIRDIILRGLFGKAARDYIRAYPLQKKEDQASFIEDVLEDLQDMDESRIVGLGITLEELKTWLSLAKKEPS